MLKHTEKLELKFFIFTLGAESADKRPESPFVKHWAIVDRKRKSQAESEINVKLNTMLENGENAIKKLCSAYINAGLISGLTIDGFIIYVGGKEIKIKISDLSAAFWPSGLLLEGHHYAPLVTEKGIHGYVFNFNNTIYTGSLRENTYQNSLEFAKPANAVGFSLCIANKDIAEQVIREFKMAAISDGFTARTFYVFCPLRLYNENPQFDLSFDCILVEASIKTKNLKDRESFEIEPEAKKALVHKHETKKLIDKINSLDYEVFKQFVTVQDDKKNMENEIKIFNVICREYCGACEDLYNLDQRAFEQAIFGSHKGYPVSEYNFGLGISPSRAKYDYFISGQNFYTFMAYFSNLFNKFQPFFSNEPLILKKKPKDHEKLIKAGFDDFVLFLRCLTHSYVHRYILQRQYSEPALLPFFAGWLEFEKQEGLTKNQELFQKMFGENFRLSLQRDSEGDDVIVNLSFYDSEYVEKSYIYILRHGLFIFFKITQLLFGSFISKEDLIKKFFFYDIIEFWRKLHGFVSDDDMVSTAASIIAGMAPPGYTRIIENVSSITEYAKTLKAPLISRKDARKVVRPLYNIMKSLDFTSSRDWEQLPELYDKVEELLLKQNNKRIPGLCLQLAYNKELEEVFFEFLPKT